MRLRRKTQTFATAESVKAYFCIQILRNRRWSFLGDDNGIFKFATAEERDAKMAELLPRLATVTP
jgi:hypothetical protein